MSRQRNSSRFAEYRALLARPEWQKKRLEIFERDGFMCRECGAKDRQLHAHHTFYSDDYEKPLDYPVRSIITVCDECHENAHRDFYGPSREIYAAIMNAGFTTSAALMALMDLMEVLSAVPERDLHTITYELTAIARAFAVAKTPEEYRHHADADLPPTPTNAPHFVDPWEWEQADSDEEALPKAGADL